MRLVAFAIAALALWPAASLGAAARPSLAGTWTLTQRSQEASPNTLPAGGDTRTWRLRFVRGTGLVLHAEKGTGGYRRVVLHWRGGRSVGVAVGRDLCLDGHYDRLGTARFRYSLRVSASERVDGRLVARRIDAYFRATYTGCGTGTGTEALDWRGVSA